MRPTTVRMGDRLAEKAEAVWKERGFTDFSAFVRQALQNEIDRDQAALDEMERHLAASFIEVQRQIRSLSTANQATFALMMSLARQMLSTWPEPPKDMATYNRAHLDGRMQRLLQAAAADFHNDLASVFSAADPVDSE